MFDRRHVRPNRQRAGEPEIQTDDGDAIAEGSIFRCVFGRNDEARRGTGGGDERIAKRQRITQVRAKLRTWPHAGIDGFVGDDREG
jgi:hypothetical protein